MKIFVGGLSWGTNRDTLRAAFEPFGAVTEAVVINDRETGRSRGFGFVTFEREEDARSAIEAMNGAALDGRSIKCNEALDRSTGGGGAYRGGSREGGFNGGPYRDAGYRSTGPARSAEGGGGYGGGSYRPSRGGRSDRGGW